MRIDKPEVKNNITMAGSSTGLVTITPAATAGTWTFTLPDSAGTDTYVLKTNGSGVTSWVAQSGGGGELNLTPTSDVSVTAGYSMVVASDYNLITTIALTIGAGGVFSIIN